MPAAACARRRRAPPFIDPSGYAHHRPEAMLLHQLVELHYPDFLELRAWEGRSLPDYVQQEFDAYLKCGRLEQGFLRVRCEGCHAEKLVAFSCKKRGFCPSCGGRRMAETAALLADEVLPERPLRREAQGDREHRRAAGECEDSGAPGEEIAHPLRRPSGGLGPVRAAR